MRFSFETEAFCDFVNILIIYGIKNILFFVVSSRFFILWVFKWDRNLSLFKVLKILWSHSLFRYVLNLYAGRYKSISLFAFPTLAVALLTVV